jgi:hypothetical protein
VAVPFDVEDLHCVVPKRRNEQTLAGKVYCQVIKATFDPWQFDCLDEREGFARRRKLDRDQRDDEDCKAHSHDCLIRRSLRARG